MEGAATALRAREEIAHPRPRGYSRKRPLSPGTASWERFLEADRRRRDAYATIE
jgi:hypothetical protein